MDKSQGAQPALQAPEDPAPSPVPFLGSGHTDLLAVPATDTSDPRAFALAVPSARTAPPQAPPRGPLLHSGMASADHPPKPATVTPTPSFPKELVTPHIIVNIMCLSGLPHPLGLCSRTWSLRPLLRPQGPKQHWASERIRGYGWSEWCLFLLGKERQWAWGTRGPGVTSFPSLGRRS